MFPEVTLSQPKTVVRDSMSFLPRFSSPRLGWTTAEPDAPAKGPHAESNQPCRHPDHRPLGERRNGRNRSGFDDLEVSHAGAERTCIRSDRNRVPSRRQDERSAAGIRVARADGRIVPATTGRSDYRRAPDLRPKIEDVELVAVEKRILDRLDAVVSPPGGRVARAGGRAADWTRRSMTLNSILMRLPPTTTTSRASILP